MSMKLFNNKIILTDDGEIRFDGSVYWFCKYIDALSMAVGASGATWTSPDSNTLGGYRLDSVTEYLYCNAKVCKNWDEASDLEVIVFWECNVDNSGGNVGDTVDLLLNCYFKGDAETAIKTQVLEEAVTVGQSPQYKQFKTTFTIDYDDGSNPVDVDDLFSFRLNLETDTSEVDNIIVNFIILRYKTEKIHIEVV